MKKFPLMEKLRELKCSLSRSRKPAPPRPVTKLRATARRIAPSAMDDYDDDQPTTKLSSAFIVVLILHIVAVGGIFAFKGIKAHRLSREVPVAAATVAHPVVADRPAAAANVLPEATPVQLAQRIYKAHGGETLAKVAALNGVSAAEIAQYNGLNPAVILKPNQNVVIPPAKSSRLASNALPASTAKPATVATTASKPATGATTKPAATPNAADQRKVAFLAASQKNDSAAAFAQTTPKPTTGTAAGNPSGGVVKPFNKTYTVAKSDTVTSIARKYGVTTDALIKLNKIEDPKKLQPNTQLQIPAKKSE